MADLTRMLQSMGNGEQGAAESLLPLVYDELRRAASQKMAREAPGQTLQATALVHEAWLRIAGADPGVYRNRQHFFRAASRAMQRILIDIARRKRSEKHGGDVVKDELHESQIGASSPTEELLAVNEALDVLQQTEPSAAEVARLRYFVGLTVPEIAEALEMAPRTVDRSWAFARAWLKDRIRASL